MFLSFLAGIFILVPIFLFALDGINLNGGEKLTKTIWDKISGIKEKIQVSGDNLNLTGGLKINGKICLSNGKCLGECETGYTWSSSNVSCVPKSCIAQNKTSNSHVYAVPSLSHSATSALLTSTTVTNITGGKKYYKQKFACSLGVLSVSGSESTSITCNAGYVQSGNICKALVSKIFAGYESSFALKTDGTVRAWGSNRHGELGVGDKENKTSPTKVNILGVKDIKASKTHAVILKTDGTIRTSGRDGNGQLGNGRFGSTSVFTKVNINGVKQIAIGNNSSFALKTDGTVRSCGYDGWGQLGIGEETHGGIPSFVQVGINGVKEIVASDSGQTVALKTDGTVRSWGNNYNGMLGLGDSVIEKVYVPTKVGISGVKDIYVGGGSTVAIKTNGTVRGWGNNDYGILGLGDTEKKTQPTLISVSGVKKVFLSNYNGFLIYNDGTLGWSGRNVYGQAFTTYKDRTYFYKKLDLSGVNEIVIGLGHSIILDVNGKLFSVGFNRYGELGVGDIEDKHTLTKIPDF